MVDIKMSEMATDSSLAGTERLLAQGADGSIIVLSTLKDYVIDELVGATAATPATGDDIIAVRSGTEKLLDLDLLSAYVLANAWDDASETSPAITGDMLLVERSNVAYRLNVNTLKTYVLVGVQATALDLTGLTAATPTGTDLMLYGNGATPKKITLANYETKLWTDFHTYVTDTLPAVTVSAASDKFYVDQGGTAKAVDADIAAVYFNTAIIALGTVQTSTLSGLPAHLTALTPITAPADADEFYLNRAGTAYKMTMSTIAGYAIDATYDIPWSLIAASKYTTTPASTSTLTMSDTSDINLGDPVKFAYGGNTYYAVVTAVSNNALITIAGAPFVVAEVLTALSVGTLQQVETKTIVIDSLYADTEYDLLSTIGRYERWDGAPAYLVSFAATGGEIDTGAAQPKINVKVGGSLVSTNDTNKGLQVSAVVGTWTANSAVGISTDNYAIEKGDAIEVSCTAQGTNGDAADLTINLIFVYE